MAVGSVTDANTFDAINGADVVNDVGGATTTEPTPDDPNAPDGVYYLFTPLPTGDGPSTRTFTASADGYGDDVVVLNMVPETINQIDFALGAGWLELAPGHLESRLYVGEPSTSALSRPTWRSTQRLCRPHGPIMRRFSTSKTFPETPLRCR